MDVPTSIENIPFVWGIAFSINVLMGIIMFAMIIRKSLPGWASGICCWIGWWSCATSLSLVINSAIGVNDPFSYHQMGVFTESMTNLGILAWGCVYLFKNWDVTGDDWEAMEAFRAKIAREHEEKHDQ